MINDQRVSKIVNEVLEEERNKTVKYFLTVQKLNAEITGNSISMDCMSMVSLYPTILLEYVDNIEKNINCNEKQQEIIKKSQKQLERWITIYCGNSVENCYEYLRQAKLKIELEFKEQTKNKGQEESLLKASAKIGGIALRNLQKENGNLQGEIEEYPYTKEQLEMIEKYEEISNKQEILEEYLEQNCSNEKQEFEDEEEM